MNKKFDVSKIREEVESRKKQQGDHAERNGHPAAPASSMSFLRSLKESVISGNPSSAVIAKMKLVEQKAYEKNPIAPKPAGIGHVLDESMSALIAPSNNRNQRNAPRHQQPVNEDHEVGGREAEMYRRMQEQNQNLVHRTSHGNSTVDNIVNEYYGGPKTHSAPQPSIGGGLMLNERAINEEIDRKFTDYINDSVNPIMEAAMKNVIIEMYSKERVKKALVEMDLTKMVKEIVIETIKELQQRNKNKA